MSRTTSHVLIALIALSLVAAACGDDASGDASGDSDYTGFTSPTTSIAPTSDVATSEYLAFRDQPVACGADVPAPAQELQFEGPSDLGLEGVVTAIIHTSCGRVTVELDPSIAPETVNSFVFLAEQGYFDGTASHRVYPGFMIQAGDPTATGRGNPGYRLPDELPSAGFLYERGIVAMANAGPDTGGSQFFMMLADTPLPPAYSVFGTVVEGLEVLDQIAQVPLTARGANPEVSSPLESVFIERVEIQR
jgi:peptidyl-prolyl cis-trans isomerase B (cyclophilin B)